MEKWQELFRAIAGLAGALLSAMFAGLLIWFFFKFFCTW